MCKNLKRTLHFNKDIRDEAAVYLGRELTDEEFEWALPRAICKLKGIIDREGDAHGLRLQPRYIGKLVEEAISEEVFSQYTFYKSEQIKGKGVNMNETAIIKA